ncbi:Phosphatidylserine/phosphatidylglycerophosphate/cardiolipin synthase [Pseudomonas arsenicoxydans]|uniref:Phosphatidylserine/phosphatidylglycerophosphate/cardiolipin synthase n=1 Tax=Pseudomonas arsenicoxydans TaxID=702115 RepID=A0A1H0CMZ2_9PSED|nr:phospholipase D-like domain-containing protein [Pseudomonas arsenicoxydans]SDN59277.1 Phosphatidylserine/phosphatidylglycerophosphate/cardiolipin synthase [Pseudomonas arsenicoxydans]
MNAPSIYVKIPFGSGTHRFKIVKAKRWGAIDQLVLQSLAQRPATSQQLADMSGLPRQLVVEILISLMQVGWVEISNGLEGFIFQATIRGIAISTYEDLPVDSEPLLRVRSFLIDPITEQCYRLERKKKKQTYQVYNYGRAQSLLGEYKGYTTEIQTSSTFAPELVDIFNCVANDDEDVNGFEEEVVRRSYSDSLKYAIASVSSENDISGVPEISEELKEAILAAADLQREKIRLLGNQLGKAEIGQGYYEARVSPRSLPVHHVESQSVTLVLGAEEHAQHIYHLIESAYSRIVLHSTFINAECVDEMLPALLDAVRRSVQVDVMWGQTEPDDPRKFQAFKLVVDKLEQLQKTIDGEGLGTQFRFHRTPTQSHAKFVIVDTPSGEWAVTIGSCNWLSSRFNRFEASVQVCDQRVVADALSIASHLAMGKQGLSNELSRELAVQSTILSKRKSVDKVKNKADLIQVQLISAAEHHSFCKKASDEAVGDIFICSHRISYAGDRPVLTPFKAALRDDPHLSIRVAYGRSSGSMRTSEANILNKELSSLNFKVIKADDPQIHAKVMTWDEDNVVITSMNWLSASSAGDVYGELGVFMKGAELSSKIRDAFESSYC